MNLTNVDVLQILQEALEVDSKLQKVDQKLREQEVEVEQKLSKQNQTVSTTYKLWPNSLPA